MDSRIVVAVLCLAFLYSCTAGEHVASPDSAEEQSECASDLNCGPGFFCQQGLCRTLGSGAGAQDGGGGFDAVSNADSQGIDAGLSTGCLAALGCVAKTCTLAGLDCWEVCAKKSQSSQESLWKSFSECVQEKCADCVDFSCWESCASRSCAAPWISCVSDGVRGDDSCRQTSDCMDGCADGDLSCLSACFSEAGADAQQELANRMQCHAEEEEGELDLDAQVACYKTEITCLCPNTIAGTGGGSCADYWPCMEACTSDACCIADCRASLTSGDLFAADAMGLCFADHCGDCPDGDDICLQQCALEFCITEVAGCYCPDVPSPGSGTGRCGAALQCVQGCSVEDACCFAACAGAASAGSYAKLLDLLECLPACGCAEGDQACYGKCFAPIFGACAAPGLACTVN